MKNDGNPPEIQPEWMRSQERSNLAILRLMVWISLTFGRRVGRWVLHGIAAYFVVCAPVARRASKDYLRRVLGRWPGWSDGFRHVFSFASTIHDRIYLLNNRFDVFNIDVVGDDALQIAMQEKQGVLLVGAHMGSFEVLRALGRGKFHFPVAMLSYEQNARKINATLAAINPDATQDMIILGKLGSMLQVKDKLDKGYAVGMLADRSMADDTTLAVNFLGEPAEFALGPWRMAAMLKRPVFFMAGLYQGGNRYQLNFELLVDFSVDQQSVTIHEAVQRYADTLARLCRQAPYNWFNFFDFWQKK